MAGAENYNNNNKNNNNNNLFVENEKDTDDSSLELLHEEGDILSDRLSNMHLVDISDIITATSPQDYGFIEALETNTRHIESSDDLFCTCDHCNQNNDKNLYQNIQTECKECGKYCKQAFDTKYTFFEEALKVSDKLTGESHSWLENVFEDSSPPKNCFVKSIYLDDSGIAACSDDVSNLDIRNYMKSIALNKSNDKLNDLIVEDIENIPYYHINDLPNEIKLNIFSYLTQRELCRYVAPVCQSWFQIAKDPFLWQEVLQEDFEDIKSYLFVQVLLSWCQNITKIQFNNRIDLSVADFRNVFENCPLIQDLSFAFCTQIDEKTLNLLPTYCKHLTTINLEGCCAVFDQSFYNFIGLPLKSICVSHCNQITDEGAIFLVQNFKNIRYINFDGIQWVTEDFIEKLVDYHSENIEEVYIDGENLTDNAVRLLSRCTNLKVLSFSFCTLMSQHALEWISQCKLLNHLQLRKGEHFTNSSLLSFFKNMSDKQGKKFKYLNIAECTEISDECLFHIANKCPNLEVLDLSWCWEISDDGLEFIINQCKNLKKLHLQGLHELFGIPFVRIPLLLPKLTFLDLSQCNKICDELIENVVLQMRELIVCNYYGDTVVNSKHTKSFQFR